MPRVARGPLDDTIHPQARLAIVAFLNGLDEASFTTLRQALDLTDGNLSVHLRRLEEAGYVEVAKAFVGRKARTTVRLTAAGRSAFAEYVETLAGMLGLPLDERFVR